MIIVFWLGLLIYVVLCCVLVTFILMQEGKGGGLSGVMGSSMGETFGFGGASKQVRKYTAICATAFFIMSVVLSFIAEAALRNSTSDFVGTDSTPTAAAPAPASAPSPVTVTPAAVQAAVPNPNAAEKSGATPGQVTPGQVKQSVKTITVTPAAAKEAPAKKPESAPVK